MNSRGDNQRVLHTTAGDFPLDECRLGVGAREWKILHVGAAITYADESHLLRDLFDRLPYGVGLWPSSVALAYDVASREEAVDGARVLELGAGTGLPGIVAASIGGRVVQTDRNALALSVCKRNGARNGIGTIEYRQADWTDWHDAARYDWILGSDLLYGTEMYPHLRRIFETNLAPAGRVLLSDPFREGSLDLLATMDGGGWTVTLNKWSVGNEPAARPVAVYELAPPG